MKLPTKQSFFSLFKTGKEKASEAIEEAQSTGERLVSAAKKAREAFNDSLDNSHPVDDGEVK